MQREEISMENKKYYPQKKKKQYPQNQSITKPFAYDNRIRYQKGHQNQLLNASRRTETITKDKTVIVTESVNVVDFNSDNFMYEFGEQKVKKKQYNNRRKY
jgi:hypothetical protein